MLKGDTEAGHIYKNMTVEYKSRYGDDPSRNNNLINPSAKGEALRGAKQRSNSLNIGVAFVRYSFLTRLVSIAARRRLRGRRYEYSYCRRSRDNLPRHEILPRNYKIGDWGGQGYNDGVPKCGRRLRFRQRLF